MQKSGSIGGCRPPLRPDRGGEGVGVYKGKPLSFLERDADRRGLCKLRIEKTEHRERIWTALQEATGERTTSKALDVAARYYLAMAGNSRTFPTGRLEELLELAEDQGSVTADEIVELLDVDELPIDRDVDVEVGRS